MQFLLTNSLIMPPPAPSPFSSARLIYRAIRQPEDLPVFQALNDDLRGYEQSNVTNIKLAGPKDTEKFMKDTAEDSYLGAVIWLPHDEVDESGQGEGERTKGAGDAKEGEEGKGDSDVKKGKEQEVLSPYGRAIGQLHLSALPPHMTHHRSTELGIDILPAYQGRGYGSEAIEWALDYAFRRAGLHRVRVRAFGWNDGAIRLYKRLGFVAEGTERSAYWFKGRFWDGLDFGMLEDEWWARERARKEESGKEQKGRAEVEEK